MRKLNKIGVTALCFVAGMTTFSDISTAQITENYYQQNYGIVYFSGVTDSADKTVTYVVKNSEGHNAPLYDIGAITASEDGSFEISFGLKNTGKYILTIKDASHHMIEKELDYMSAKDREDYLLSEINSEEDKRVEKALDEINLSFEDKLWNEISDDDKKADIIKGIMKNQYEDFDAVKKEYEIQNVLYKINTSKATGIVSVLKEYSENLGIDDDEEVKTFISKSNDAKKRALVNLLSRNPAYLVDDLLDAIEEANEVKATTTGGSGGGGGGSSSGKGASTAGSANILYPATNKTEDDKQEEAISYYDLNDAAWAKDAVISLSEQGIISGDGNGYFRPNDKVKREEFVKMVVMAFSIPYENANCDFIDVFKSDWFYEYVGAANRAGVVKGLSEDFFGVHKNITRQDAAVILARAAEYAGVELDVIRDIVSFSDDGEIAEYAKDAVVRLYQNGTINGMPDGSFKPQNVCTRAEAAKMIYEIL